MADIPLFFTKLFNAIGSNFDLILTKIAGVCGALISMNFVKGTWPERLIMAAGGFALSIYLSPYLALKSGIPEGGCGLIIGLFGMQVAARVYEGIRVTDVGAIIKGFFRKG